MYQARFGITRAELWEQGILAMYRAQGWSVYFQPAGYAVITIVLALVPQYCSSCDLDSRSYIAGLCLMYIAKLSFDYFLFRHITKLHTAPNGITLEERQFRADDHSIVVEGSNHKCVYTWGAIKGVSEGKSILVLWTDNGWGLIIPKHAFTSPAELGDFKRMAEAKVAAQASYVGDQRA